MSVVTWAATRPLAACTASIMAAMALVSYVEMGRPKGRPSVTGEKSAITFTHRAPFASWARASSVSWSWGAPSGIRAG